MTLPVIDLATLTDAEVTELKSLASLEEQRRIRVAAVPAATMMFTSNGASVSVTTDDAIPTSLPGTLISAAPA